MPPMRVRRGSRIPRWSYSLSSFIFAVAEAAEGEEDAPVSGPETGLPQCGQTLASVVISAPSMVGPASRPEQHYHPFIFADYTKRVPISPAINPAARPRMLVCDLDGTLLNGQSLMTQPTLSALQQAVEAGIEVVFATGRRHSYACTVLDSAGFHRNTVLVSSNGAITRTMAGERMQRTSMPVATALLLCRHLMDYRESLIFTFERTGPGSMAVQDIDALHQRLPRWVDSNRHEIACCLPLETAFDSGNEPIQAMICGTVTEMKEARIFLDSPAALPLRQNISLHRTEYIHRDLSVLDLMPRGCSKGAAIARLAGERGINAAEIACIGDNMNDADMLAFAGQPIVMKNAAAELLAMAESNGWTITGSNDEDGAAHAILRMLNDSPRASERNFASFAIPAVDTVGS